ncbi:MAG TPA: hypothetical protein VLZ74_07480 [Methylocella sp.]|nr:hypothetical protein [Methylocella sp.]
MLFDRLTWTGFMIVVLGWALLFSAPQLAELLGSFGGRSLDVRSLNVPALAACTILSGFGIAILGALQTGFGALNRFFDSVLERSAKAGTHTLQRRPEQPRKIIERGWLKDRAYVLFMDGSVEIETLLGRRLFPSLQEAQEFIA